MFYIVLMQFGMGFLRNDIVRWRNRLAPLLAAIEMLPPRSPTGQLIKSMISGRTRDAVSQAAYDRLCARFGSASRLAAASVSTIEAVIADVTFAPDKAQYLVSALTKLRRTTGGIALTGLRSMPLDQALAFLEDLPGVGRKVAASTLNASTLAMPVMIVDTHVLRVLRRLGAVAPTADIRAASEAVTAEMAEWTGSNFLNLHVVLKLLGQLFCHDTAPRCDICPLASDCRSRMGRRPTRRAT
jgi:endonuclease III